MIPIGDESRAVRTPVITYLLLALLVAVWVLVQGGGFDERVLAATVCNLGLVPGEITNQAVVGTQIPIGPGLACAVDREPVNVLTPLTSMFLHGSWGHLLGNALFLWVFGRAVEDSTGRFRFLVFYVLCGLAAAAAQVLVNPISPVPMVGASGAISGVLGGYLVLYPRVRVRVLFVWFVIIQVLRIPAYLVLLWWIAYQVLLGLPELTALDSEVSAGVAFWAHIGGFVAGLIMIKLFARKDYVERHRAAAFGELAQGFRRRISSVG
jgi:membrane associated rhomboid family serine protease